MDMMESLQLLYFKLIAAPKLNLDGAPKSPDSGAISDTLLTNVLNGIYLVAGVIAVIAIIFGGFWYITSDGQPDKIKRGKMAIVYSVIGIVVILMAWSITGFVAGRVEL